MKNTLVIFSFFIWSFQSFSQAPIWINPSTGYKANLSNNMAVGLDNCLYILGPIMDEIKFGSLTLSAEPDNSQDLYLVKYDSDGNLLWGKKIGGLGGEQENGICIDTNGDIIIGGWYSGTDFRAGNVTKPAAGKRDVFLCKISPSGDVLKVYTYATVDDDYCERIGMLNGKIIALIGCEKQTSPKSHQIFIKVFNDDLVEEKSILVSNGYYCWAKGMASNDTGGIIYAGIGREDNSSFDGLFLKKFDSDFNLVYKTEITGGTLVYAAYDFDVLQDGSLLWGGMFTDSIRINNVALFSQGNQNGHITWLDPNGSIKDIVHLKGRFSSVRRLKYDQGLIYVSGVFNNVLAFGQTQIYAAEPSINSYLAIYDSRTKNWLSAQKLGGEEIFHSNLGGFAFTPNSFYTNLSFSGTFSWDSFKLRSDTTDYSGSTDMVIIKHSFSKIALGDLSSHKKSLINLFPNPASSTLTITVDEILYDQIISILDVNSRVVYKTEIPRLSKIELPIENLPSGHYTLKLSNSINTIIKSFVVSK